MRKRYIVAVIGAVGAGTLVSYLLSDENNRRNLKNNLENSCQKVMNFITKSEPSILEDAGFPGQLKKANDVQMENADMVSEGSQYGVNYFNEVRAEHDSENETAKS